MPATMTSSTSSLLRFDQVSKWYGPVIGLNEVSLDLGPGITGLVGPNGAGKSTLMKLATGQLRPDLGTVRIKGHAAWSSQAKRFLGFCPESDRFYEEMSGRAFVRCMARLFGFSRREARQRTESTLALVGMEERSERAIRGYSKGMRQRIKLAQALVHDPDLLILDEPMNGIDPVGRREWHDLFQKLADQGKSILLSSHQLEELEKITDRIIVMARGLLVAQGTVAEIRDLLENQPMAVRIDCDQPRRLAAALLQMPSVLGVELAEPHGVLTRAKHPRLFFPALTALVVEEGFTIDRIEALDYSAKAILDYFVKGGR